MRKTLDLATFAWIVCGSAGLRAADIAVDPPGPGLRAFTSIGEWEVDGDMQGWTTSGVAGAAAAGGVFAGSDDATGGIDPQAMRTGLVDGPDLDLGYNDFIEIRLELAAGYAGAVDLFWGTTAAPAFSSARTVRIPADLVRADGAFHVYRIDMGLVPAWRDALHDIRIDPFDAPDGTGRAFALDYVRVGDLGPDYLPNYLYYAEGEAGVNDSMSKHFRVVWGPSDEITMSWGNFTTNGPALARGNLRNMEDQWQVYVKTLGYREPCESVEPAKRDGNRYKVNLFVGRTGLEHHEGGGYYMGYEGTAGFGYLIIDTSGLRVDPPSWVNPHELGHVFQVHQSGYNNNSYMGFWWECHANWFREKYLGSPLYPERGTSGFGSAFPRNAQLFHGHGRHYYDHWPIWSYLEENPEALPGLGRTLPVRLWQEALPGEYIYDEIERLCPGVSVKDVVGYYARRNVTWDYANRTAIWGALGIDGNLNFTGSYLRQAFAELARQPDDPARWVVPLELAPMQGAYTLVELTPEGSGGGRVVTVELHGLPVAGRASDWRASLIAVDAQGIARYGALWGDGAESMVLSAADTRLFLSVAATPDTFIPQTASEEDYPYATHPARARFPFEVRLTGAVPRESRPSSVGQGAPHPRGGGFVAATARVDASAYVGPNAKVLDAAQVRGNARIEDYAVVEDNAQVLDNAVVSGHGNVRDRAIVSGFGKVRDYGQVRDNARVSDRGRVLEHGTVAETMEVTERGVVKGFAYAWDDPNGGKIAGNGICDGDYAAGHAVASAVLCGWLIGAEYAASRAGTLPAGLYAGFEFHREHPSLVEDFFGVTHGIARGDPVWTANDDVHEGVLSFDGRSQYAILPRSVSDLEDMTIGAWVKWDGGAANQRLFEFGSAGDARMYLTPDDGTGSCELLLMSGGVRETLAAAALPPGIWKHVAVTLEGDAGTLWIDGAAAAAGTISIDPEDLNAPNANATPQANYLGRGQEGDYFAGRLDNFRVYSRALDATEIAVLAAPPPVTLIAKGAAWKYQDSGADLGTTWREPAFDDAAWRQGPAQLGFGDGDEETVIANRRQITTYFRRTFSVADAGRVLALSLRVLRDDGAVVYLNGVEAMRSNMPEGAVDYRTTASANASSGDESTNFYAAAVDPALLANGANVVAVEVHQASATSSDLSFDLELAATVKAASIERRSFHRGDPNADGAMDIADAIFTLAYLFSRGTHPTCTESADTNNDGTVDISDAVSILAWLFGSGRAPAAPGPVDAPCGLDPDPQGSSKDSGCTAYAPCE